MTVSWSSSDTFTCVGSGFSTGGKKSGSVTVTASGTGTKTYSVTCQDDSPKCALALKSTEIDDYGAPNNCSGSNSVISYSPSGSCYPKYAQCTTSSSNQSAPNNIGKWGGGFELEGGTYTNNSYRCEGGCSSTSASDTVYVNTPPPTPTLTASVGATPSTVTSGDSVQLSWSSTGAEFCSSTNFSSGGSTVGSATVTPTQTTTYTLKCTEAWSSTGYAWVNVNSGFTKICSANNDPSSGVGATSFQVPFCEDVAGGSPPSGSCTINQLDQTCKSHGWEGTGACAGQGTVYGTVNTYRCQAASSGVQTYPGTWQYVGNDITDLWCTSNQPSYSNYYTNNQCPGNQPPSGSCTGPDSCAVNSWQTKGGTVGDAGSQQYCNLNSELYQCNATGGSTAQPATKTVSVTVNVNGAPNAPTIDGSTSGAVALDHTFSFRATDPDGDDIRYRIDWDSSSSVDQNLPSSGYVNSNTLLNAIRSWLAPGTYSFRALTQDENGAQSTWSTHTIAIGASGPACSDAIDNDGDGLVDYPSDPGCSSGSAGTEAPQCSDGIENDDDGNIDYPSDYGCSSAADDSEAPNPQCSDGIDNNGNEKIDYPEDPACASATDNNEEALAEAVLSLTATPQLTQSNTPVLLNWTATDVEDDSCSLSGTNGDSWSLSGDSGNRTSSALDEETLFSLQCTDLNGDPVATSVTVRLVPTFQEI